MRALGAGGWVAGVLMLIMGEQSFLAAEQRASPVVSATLAAEEREACTRNLKVIYDAIQAYQYDHKDLPNWLSDLVPDYISDGNVLICPVCRRTGRTELPPLADPKLACSYVFEFSPVPVGKGMPGEPRHTRREWKRRQMGLVGSVVPVVRCRNHNPVLNLGFNGSIYESPMQWELLFTNRVRTAELSLNAIFGGEVAEDAVAPFNESKPEPMRSQPTTSTHCIDLGAFFNSELTTSWLGQADDDLDSLPTGLQKFGSVEFNVKGLIQLKGQSQALSKFPAEVKGIPVHQRCQHLYFLHAAAVTGTVAEGEQIGSYVVHIPKNELTLDIPLYYGRSMADWHQASDAHESNELKVAWTGENAESKRSGKQIRLFITAWNLAPGVEIETLDFVSTGRNAAPFLLAISFD